MQTNNHKIVDYDLVLDEKFGKEGTPERIQAEEAAYSFYSGQILQRSWRVVLTLQSRTSLRLRMVSSFPVLECSIVSSMHLD